MFLSVAVDAIRCCCLECVDPKCLFVLSVDFVCGWKVFDGDDVKVVYGVSGQIEVSREWCVNFVSNVTSVAIHALF